MSGDRNGDRVPNAKAKRTVYYVVIGSYESLEAVKKARAEALQALSARQYGAFLGSCVGGTEAVLFERERDGAHRGHTPRFAPVRIPAAPGAPSLRGQVRPVRIVSVEEGALAGELV